jgi:Flp pilus assembly protein TadG
MRSIRGFIKLWKDSALAANQRGAALIEFVLTFPILVFATLFVFDIGRSAFTIMTLNGAAADAARWASVHGTLSLNPADDADIAAFALDRAFGVGPGTISVGVTWDPSPMPGAEVEVEITYTMDLIMARIANVDPMPVRGHASVTVH